LDECRREQNKRINQKQKLRTDADTTIQAWFGGCRARRSLPKETSSPLELIELIEKLGSQTSLDEKERAQIELRLNEIIAGTKEEYTDSAETDESKWNTLKEAINSDTNTYPTKRLAELLYQYVTEDDSSAFEEFKDLYSKF
jgi:hypothetical protein